MIVTQAVQLTHRLAHRLSLTCSFTNQHPQCRVYTSEAWWDLLWKAGFIMVEWRIIDYLGSQQAYMVPLMVFEALLNLSRLQWCVASAKPLFIALKDNCQDISHTST